MQKDKTAAEKKQRSIAVLFFILCLYFGLSEFFRKSN